MSRSTIFGAGLTAVALLTGALLTASHSSAAATDPQVTGTDLATSSTATTQRGDTVQWTLSNLNAGQSSADVTVTDPIPAGETYVNGSLQVPPTWTGSVTSNVVHAAGPVDASVQTSTPVNVPAPDFDAAATDGDGDGYAPIPYGDNVYVVHHHHGDEQAVNCVNKVTRAVCPGFPKSLQIPAGADYLVTSTILDTYLDPAGRLYFAAGAAHDDQVNPVSYTTGIACIQLPSADPCATGGFYPTGIQDSDFLPSGLVKISDKLWSFAIDVHPTLASAYTCMQIAADGSLSYCGASNVPPTAYTGTFAELTAVSGEPVANVTNQNSVPGVFPFSTQRITRYHSAGIDEELVASTPLRWIDASGNDRGFCYHRLDGATNDVCYDASSLPSAAVAAPAALSTLLRAATEGSEDFSFGYSPLVVGTKEYIPVWKHASLEVDGITDAIVCFDWATSAACPEFGNTSTPGFLDTSAINGGHQHTYGLAIDDQHPQCGWAYGDAAQLFNFQVVKGADCGGGQTSAQVSLDSAAFYCGVAPQGHHWTTLTLSGIPASAIDSARVTILDADNHAIPAYADVPLPSNGILDISSIPTSGSTSKLTAQLTLDVDAGPFLTAQPTLTIAFDGPAGTVCFKAVNDDSCRQIPTTAGITNTAHVVVQSSAGTQAFDPSAHLAIDPADPTNGPCVAPTGTTSPPHSHGADPTSATAVSGGTSVPSNSGVHQGTDADALATTGTPVQRLLLLGSLLAACGTVLLIVARRRSAHRTH